MKISQIISIGDLEISDQAWLQGNVKLHGSYQSQGENYVIVTSSAQLPWRALLGWEPLFDNEHTGRYGPHISEELAKEAAGQFWYLVQEKQLACKPSFELLGSDGHWYRALVQKNAPRSYGKYENSSLKESA